ncbi:MAG: cbb3-type cytochrome oxidase assembly protein CcoS [Candidatus Obscuribacterales bacterium]|nr:cbb3-type cytochrome oxidase assembly protein CcoS [Candidatus Obscuribacterales bacterium]
MCPNCILNQAPLDAGLYVAFGVCGVFFIVGIIAMWWAFGNGEFEDLEGSKFDMLDDGDDNTLAQRAREAVERARAVNTVKS